MDFIQKERVQSFLGDRQKYFDIEVFEEVSSTNDLLKSKAKEGLIHPYHVIIASYQSQGRGRLGRSFFSPKDSGLYMSVYIEANALAESLTTTMQAGVSAFLALSKISPQPLQIKWVNDIYQGRKKVGGILTEGMSLPNQRWGLVMGIGINFYPFSESLPEDIMDKAGFVLSEPKQDIRNRFIADFLNTFYEFIEKKKSFISIYKEAILNGEKMIEIIRDGERYFGEILDVTDAGHLVIRREEGDIEELCSGEISTRWRQIDEEKDIQS